MTNKACINKVCMGMLATSGGSSIVAQSIGKSIVSRGENIDVRYCHLRPSQINPDHFLLDSKIGCANSKLLDISSSFGSSMDSTSELLRVHDKWPFDLFHLHNLQVFGLPALMLKQLRNIPYIITCHGSDILNSQLFDQNLEIASKILKSADAITCVSNHLANTLHHKVPGLNNVEVINNFISPDWVKPVNNQPISNQKFLHVSSMRSVKRPELLLAAFAKLQQSLPQAQLSIITTNEGINRVDKMLSDGLHSGQGIKLINGDNFPEALAHEYASSKALILTSKFEGFGLVVLEALQYDLPVITPNVGALSEVLGKDWPYLIDEQNPEKLVVKIANAMEQVAATSGQQLQTPIATITKRFEGTEQVNQYLALYNQTLQQYRS